MGQKREMLKKGPEEAAQARGRGAGAPSGWPHGPLAPGGPRVQWPESDLPQGRRLGRNVTASESCLRGKTPLALDASRSVRCSLALAGGFSAADRLLCKRTFPNGSSSRSFPSPAVPRLRLFAAEMSALGHLCLRLGPRPAALRHRRWRPERGHLPTAISPSRHGERRAGRSWRRVSLRVAAPGSHRRWNHGPPPPALRPLPRAPLVQGA